MRSARVVIVGGVALLAALLPACSPDPQDAPLPDGVSALVDQGRMQRQDRGAFVRISNRSDRDLVVSDLVLTSSRSRAVVWTGTETVGAGYDTDVVVTLPRGRCGGTTRYTVTLTYRVGDGGERRSTLAVEDRYGAVTRVLDGDCARATLEGAARLDVGLPVEDGGALRIPVTLTPRDRASAVRIVGYRPTPLVRPTRRSATDVAVGGAPVRADLVLEPARCDPHAIAEDKVGRLVPVEVSAPGLPDGTTFVLPLDRQRRTAILDYVRSACGLD
ncbi:hypothetical protein GCM10008944_32690 [Cytobacillus oceanisediminis]